MPTTIDTLRNITVDFAKPYDWEVSFPDFGDGQFFPASVLNDTLLAFQSGHMDYGPWPFPFPEKAIRGKILSLEIFEIGDYRIVKYLQKWKNEVNGNEFCVRLLKNPGVTRLLTIHRLNPQREPMITEILEVIPEGDINVNHTSDKGGTPLSVQLNLTVVGSNASI